MAAPLVPRGIHLALPDLVAGARRARGPVLLQQREITERLAGLLLALVLPDPVNSVLHDPALHAAVVQTIRLSVYVTLITVPLGVAFALGINRWRGYTASSANFLMILSFVIPELIFGVAMFFVFTRLFTPVGLGSLAEVLALVTWNVSWGPHRAGQAGDARQAVRGGGGRPRRHPVAGHIPGHDALAHPGHLRQCGPGLLQRRRRLRARRPAELQLGNTPMSVYIYSQQRGGNGGPALNALGTIMLVMSFVVAILGYIGYRWLTRGERGSRIDALTTIAGSEG